MSLLWLLPPWFWLSTTTSFFSSFSASNQLLHLVPPATQPPADRGSAPTPGDGEGLSSLLSEIVFLNQQNVATATEPEAAVGGAKEQSHAPQASDDPVAMETEEEEAEPAAPTHDVTRDGGLAPPPLLQMKVGGAKATAPGSSDATATERGGGGATGQGGVAWRPMPRLVPLGLRGAPPT